MNQVRQASYRKESQKMKQLFLKVNDGSVETIETPAPTDKDGCLIVETKYSVVSAGTERTLASFGGKNLLQKVKERPDQAKQVLDKMAVDGVLSTLDSAFHRLNEPMPIGYSAVGKVISCGRGVTEFSPGDMVAMVGQAYHAEVNRVSKNLAVKIPEGVQDFRQYALCALGGIALEGIHQAQVVSGETVAVIGLGLVGHVVARILDAYGCDVIGYDIADKSMPGTRLKAFIRSDDENAAAATNSLTHGRGVDKVIVTAAANSNGPMDLASAIVRDRGIICMIGVTQMNLDRRPYYQKELTFTIARSYGPGRYDPNYEEKSVDYPIGHVRFTEGRNIEEFVRLVSSGRADFTDLITHTIPLEQADRAYEMITTNKAHERYIAILLEYPDRDGKWDNTIHIARPGKKTQSGQITVGIIGAGNFARNTMIPNMKAAGLYRLKTLATTGGVGAGQVGDDAGFEVITNDYKTLLSDPDVDLVAISTNHNSHAKFIVEALEAGKHVYCEKPLCLTMEELDRIEAAYRKSGCQLFCGMNRRHAPLIKQIRKELSTDKSPAVYDYIANAGQIPETHWTQDEKVGGGRLIGEACHFIDTIQYLDGSQLTDLHLTYADNSAYPCKDNALITLSFSSGAIGSILYTSMGSKKYPKEQLRVFSNGAVRELNNYVGVAKYDAVKTGKIKLRQDKGVPDEYKYIAAVIQGKQKNDAIEDAFVSHRLLLRAIGNEKQKA